MKTSIHEDILKRTTALVAATGLISGPLAFADDDLEFEFEEDGGVEVEDVDVEERVEEITDPEIEIDFEAGDQIPEDYNAYFRPLPALAGTEVRYYAGNAYYIDPDSWEVRHIVGLRSGSDATANDVDLADTFEKDKAIPVEYRERFVAVPDAEEESGDLDVRYYNGTLYYVNADNEIVRTVPIEE